MKPIVGRLVMGSAVLVTLFAAVRTQVARGGEVEEGVVPNAPASDVVSKMIAASAFNAFGTARPIHARDGSVAALASVGSVRSTADSLAVADGMIVARIKADRATEDYGLSQGVSYLWIDRLGPDSDPWRALVVSADGRNSRLLGSVRYSADGAHSAGMTVLDHAQRYCDGDLGCFLASSTLPAPPQRNAMARALDGFWVPCGMACCQVEGR